MMVVYYGRQNDRDPKSIEEQFRQTELEYKKERKRGLCGFLHKLKGKV